MSHCWLNQKARDLRRSYKKPPCERERAALGLAVGRLNQKARDWRRSYKNPPCERERAALGLAVCGLNRKARDLRRSYKKPSLLQNAVVRTGVAAPTETRRADGNRPRQQNQPLLDLAVGATQVASLSTRSASPLPPNRRSGVSAVLMVTSLEGFRDSI